MRGLLLAALVEAGIISWRDLSSAKVLPMPSDYVAVAVFFGALGLFPASAGKFPAYVGWGMVLATFFNLYDPRNPTKLVYPGGAQVAGTSGQAQTAGASAAATAATATPVPAKQSPPVYSTFGGGAIHP